MFKFKDVIGEAAMYEMLAEECTELAKAALKMARIIRRENPTPVTKTEARWSLIEEYTDVVLVAGDVDLHIDKQIFDMKMQRGRERLKEAGYVETQEEQESQPQKPSGDGLGRKKSG